MKFSISPFSAAARWIATRPARGWRAAPLAVLAALLVQLAFGARAAHETPAAEGKPAPVKIVIHYLGKQYEEPVPLSLVDPEIKDNGIQGARLAIQDNNKSGQFLGQEYQLVEDIVPDDGDVAAKAKEILKDGPAIIVADLEAKDLLAVADLPEAKAAIIFNIRLSNDALRGEQCRFNVFHIAPTWSMRADALAQYLIWKKWNKWFVLKGVSPSDKDYDAAVQRAAGRFGGTIVDEREYKFDTANPRTDSGHQQIQTQMPEVTQGAPEHDVVWVVDTCRAFRRVCAVP
ncbi:MAG: ABC transporter substrate-binding protein [Methyloceanibacter sp.]